MRLKPDTIDLQREYPLMIVMNDPHEAFILPAGCTMEYAALKGLPRATISSSDGGRVWSLGFDGFPREMTIEIGSLQLDYFDWTAAIRCAVRTIYEGQRMIGNNEYFNWFPLLGMKIGAEDSSIARKLFSRCFNERWVDDAVGVFQLQAILRGLGDELTLGLLAQRVRKFMRTPESLSRFPNCVRPTASTGLIRLPSTGEMVYM